MEFFDDALNKAKEVFDVARTKTGEVVNTEKLKFDVASLKSKREKDFAALGKIYFETVKDSGELNEDAARTVDEIKQKNAKIKEITAEIMNLKNKRICPNCGSAIATDSTFCKICGAKITFEDEK